MGAGPLNTAENTAPNVTDRAVTIREAAAMTGLSAKAIARRVDRGVLPAFLREERGQRLRYVLVRDLEKAGLLAEGERPIEESEERRVDQLIDRIEGMGRELGSIAAELRAEVDE